MLRVQYELREALGPDALTHCPFCDFAVTIENDEQRVFRCLNQDCLKESCVDCKRANHRPRTCAQAAEADAGDGDAARTHMRVFIEQRMAAALIRHCPRCKTPIVKSEGCNRLQCQCGTHFCYMCNLSGSMDDVYRHLHNKCVRLCIATDMR